MNLYENDYLIPPSIFPNHAVESIIAQPHLFVDKTDLIADLLQFKQQAILFCRPRCFGKTTIIHLLKEILTNGITRLHDFKIAKYCLYSEQERYKVLHLDFSRLNNSFSQQDYAQLLGANLKTACKQADISLGDSFLDLKQNYAEWFIDVLENAKEQSIALLVDEYDSSIIASLGDTQQLCERMMVLNSFFQIIKSYAHKFRFIFITGVNRLNLFSNSSGFNKIQDISFDQRFNALCGFTQEEITSYYGIYFAKLASFYEIELFDFWQELKNHYNGYCFELSGTQSVFNPWDIISLLKEPVNKYQPFPSFWRQTGRVSDFWPRLFKEKQLSLEAALHYWQGQIILDENQLKTNIAVEQAPLESLLFATGYLSLQKASDLQRQQQQVVLDFPNKTVKSYFFGEFYKSLCSFLPKKEAFDNSINSFQQIIYEFAQNFSQCDTQQQNFYCEQVRSSINLYLHRAGINAQDSFEKETRLNYILALLISSSGYFDTFSEIAGINSRSDLCFIEPKTKSKFIIELKLLSTKVSASSNTAKHVKQKISKALHLVERKEAIQKLSQQALLQIKHKRYQELGPLNNLTQLIGMSMIFDAQNKELALVEAQVLPF